MNTKPTEEEVRQERIIQHNLERWKREKALRLKSKKTREFPVHFNNVGETIQRARV